MKVSIWLPRINENLKSKDHGEKIGHSKLIETMAYKILSAEQFPQPFRLSVNRSGTKSKI